MTPTQREGSPCSFYLDGWRFGYIVRIAGARPHENDVRVEVRVPLFSRTKGGYSPKPFTRYWVPVCDVNAPGDTTYHGPRAEQAIEDRAEKKAAEQAKADKIKRKMRRFHR